MEHIAVIAYILLKKIIQFLAFNVDTRKCLFITNATFITKHKWKR